MPYPSTRWVPSGLWWSQSNKKWGEVDGLRKKRNPRFHARVKLRKEEDMMVGRQEPEEARKGDRTRDRGGVLSWIRTQKP
jgi:hypothetical protein